MNDLCTGNLDLYTMLENCCKHSILYTGIGYVNDVTEHDDRRYELVQLKMELVNSALRKCQCQFQFRSLKNFNSNSIHFGSILIPN